MDDLVTLEEIECVQENEPVSIEKVKKPRTEKQKEAFAAALLKRDEKRKERKETKNTVVIEKTKVQNEKIIKKAILLKKKELRDDLLTQLDDDKDIDDDIKKLRLKIERKKIATLPPPAPFVPPRVFIYR